MLALKDHKGDVHASVPGLADAARVTRAECDAALKRLGETDPDSSNEAEGGRRILPIEGGWFVVSHEKYRRMLSIDERRERDAARKRVQRQSANVRDVRDVAECPPSDQIRSDQDPPIPRRGVSRARLFDESWMPSRTKANIQLEGEVKDLKLAAAEFKDWARGTTRRYRDWDSTWRNHLRRDIAKRGKRELVVTA